MFESLCTFRLVAALLSGCTPPGAVIAGYVEGEFVQLAPLEVAQIKAVSVRRGARINPGDEVAMVETADADIALRDAEARLGQVQAELVNLRIGRRPEEIAVIEATHASAQAQARDARRALERRQDLFKRGFAAQAELDQAQTAVDVAEGKVRELAANLAVARLPARADEIAAAENRVAQARAGLDQARWRLSQRRLVAPAAGRITDVIRRPGEVAGPNAPVLSMLPDGAVKLKLYVPEKLISGIAVGAALSVRCDGCGPGLSATVSYVSGDPEFTPPVIYSLETRQKLVYLVEARPDGGATSRLQPGQIVDVSLRDAAK